MLNRNASAKKSSHRQERDLYMSFSELTFLKPHGEKRWNREEQEKRNAPLNKKGESSPPLMPHSSGKKMAKEVNVNANKNDMQPQKKLSQVGKLGEYNPVDRNIIIDDSLDFECITFAISPRQSQPQKAEIHESSSRLEYSSYDNSEPSESSSSDESTDEASLKFKKPY